MAHAAGTIKIGRPRAVTLLNLEYVWRVKNKSHKLSNDSFRSRLRHRTRQSGY